MIEIHTVRVPQYIGSRLFRQLLLLVSKEKRHRIEKYIRVHDKYRTLIGDLLVRFLIRSKCDMENEDITFTYNSFGKPYLLNPVGFFFNVSHSSNWVVCITHDHEVGVDIEKVQPIDIAIFERFFTVEEYHNIIIKNKIEQLSSFYELWTIKESFVKMIGKGLSIPLNSFCIKNNKILGTQQPYIDFSVHFKQYVIDSGYIVSGCAMDDSFPDKIEIVSFSSLCNDFF